MKSRTQALARIRELEEVPVLIIGAGVNGIGTFRDLALQGIDVVMVDRADFCSGASSASSHMLHGGIRYLENGEFRLVREALQERNRLLRNAPHLTSPLPTAIPVFKRFSGLLNAPLKFLGLLDRPSERGALVIKIGLLLYDAFVGGDSPTPSHRFYDRRSALEHWPALNPEALYVARYFDGFMPSPERICMELISDAQRDHDGALAINYMPVVGSEGEAILLQEEDGSQIKLRPEVVVNAAGPWIDLTNQRLDQQTDMIGGTKGSHLILDHPELRAALSDHEFFFEYFDGRIVLILPYLDKVIVGTTDIRIEDPDQAQCTQEEIEYLLGMIPTVFPNIAVGREHIIFQFSGVRPLPTAEGSTGQISRDHKLEILEPSRDRPFPVFNLIGGKWTTYRAFSEKTADAVMDRLGVRRRASTADLVIGGGAGFPTTDGRKREWVAARAQGKSAAESYLGQLLQRYGSRADRYLPTKRASQAELLPTDPQYSIDELRAIIRNECVWHLDDVILRRTLLAWTGQVNPSLLNQVSRLMAEGLGWLEDQRQAEVARARAIMADDHGVVIE